MTLNEIFIYPIKSMGSIAQSESVVKERGLQHDRRWTLVDKNQRFLSQRSHPQLALFQPSISKDNLIVRYQDKEVEIPLQASYYEQKKDITVWDDRIHSLIAPPLINDWFSQMLDTECELAYQGKESIRLTNPNDAPVQQVSYSDGAPYLIISEASLKDLNARMDTPLPINRFRPNFVVSGLKPFEEDTCKTIRIGTIDFLPIKPCARCKVTTIDQETLESGVEPLKTLASYRKVDNKVNFGQNLQLIGSAGKLIRVGDTLELKK